MSSTTGDHINELEARRRRRHRRQTATTDANAPRGSKPAEQARDLLRDLITNGPPQGEEAPVPSEAASASASQTDLEQSTNGASATEPRQPESPRDGERVDELVRRVRVSSQTIAADAASATRKRPTGTAALAADAASRRRPPNRAPHRFIQSAAHAIKANARPPRWGAAAAVLAAGIVLIVSLTSGGERRSPSAWRADSLPAQLSTAAITHFGRALRSTVAELDRELRPASRVAAGPPRHLRRRAKHMPRHPRPRAATVQHQTPAQTARPAATTSPSTTTTTTQSHTYTPVQTPDTHASQSSATAPSSNSSSRQSAGPTNQGPLGGIGSCVKGCT
jgi:hypothetical protein